MLYAKKDWSILRRIVFGNGGGEVPEREHTIIGNPVTFCTNLEKPIEMLIPFAPVQDLHGQDSPYPAGGGKNKFNIADAFDGTDQTVSGTTITKAYTGYSFDLFNGTTGSSSIATKKMALTAGTYTISGTITGTGNLRVYGCDSEGNVESTPIASISSSTGYSSFTLASDGYITIRYSNRDALEVKNPQIESGSSATSYAPYSNICPISGWTGAEISRTGVNLWNEVWEAGYISNGGSNADAEGFIRSKNFISVLPTTEYYFLIPGSYRVFYYRADKTFISYNGTYSSARALTTPSNCKYVRFYTNQSTYGNDISINYPATDTSYHPGVQNETYSITFPSSVGTVYGGTLTVNKDGTGKLVVDMEMSSALSNRSWTMESDEGKSVFSSTIFTDKKANYNYLCNKYKATNKLRGSLDNLELGIYNRTNGINRFCIRDDSYSDATTFKNSLTDAFICFELATPVEIDLTELEVIETLKGVNNVWADTNGENTVKYMKKG